MSTQKQQFSKLKLFPIQLELIFFSEAVKLHFLLKGFKLNTQIFCIKNFLIYNFQTLEAIQ
jgi:hypothetical protein